MRNKFFLLIIVLSTLANTCLEDKQEESVRNPNASSTSMTPEDPPPNKPKVDESISLDYLMGKFDYSIHPEFTEISTDYASKAGMYLRKDSYEALEKMIIAARLEGINLKVISATRNFDHQKRIWEAKWRGGRLVEGKDLSKSMPDGAQRATKILEYSSMPGTSRHHWGTDFDLNDLNPEYFKSGTGKKIHEWLIANGPDFGFCQPYSPKGSDRPFGYEEEQWHWSYLPVSKQLTEQYVLRIQDADISGFAGSEFAGEINMIEKWVAGINPSCK